MAKADVKNVSQLDVEPGELPKTMTAWVIRQEREGEPKDAFQIEEIEVPEPGAFEVIVRVMAAGVNFNNVWAALGEPVSVFLPLTFVTGFFGMNFGWMVRHIDSFGTFLALGIVGTLVPALATALLLWRGGYVRMPPQ